MTVKLSISVPDDVAVFLASTPNTSAAIVEAIRDKMPESRKARQRRAAVAYAAWKEQMSARDRTAIEELDATTFDISARGAEW